MKTSSNHPSSGFGQGIPTAALLAAAALLFPAFLPLAGAQSAWTGTTDGTWGTANNWDPSGVPSGVALTFGTVASGNYTIDLGATNRTAAGASALTFTSSNDYTFTNGTLGLANSAGMAMNGSGDAIFNIPVTFGGSGKALSGSGSGALIFNGAVTRGGGNMAISTHVIFAGADNNTMGSGGITINNGGIVELAKSNQTAQETALGSALVALGGGTLRISTSSAVFANSVTVGANNGTIEANQSVSFDNLNMNGIRTITFTGPATVTFTGNLTQVDSGVGTRTTTIDGAGNSIFNGTVNNNSGTSFTAITKSGAGTTRFNSTNSNYTGPTTLNGGVLEVVGLADGGSVSGIGQATSDAANLVLNGGTLRYVGAGNSTNRAFTLGASGGTIDSSGTGALTMTAAAMAHGTGVRTLTLTGTNTGNNSLATVINDGAGATNLAKTGNGLWSLSGTNTYTGSTAITAGTLVVASTGSINGTSGVTLNGSNAALRYNGNTNLTAPLTWTQGRLEGTNWNGSLGNLTVGANQIISPGNSPGTAETTSQTWAGGGSYIWEINDANNSLTPGSDPGWDLVSGTGTLTITATDVSQFTIYVTSLTLSNTPGLAVNFDNTLPQSWLIADFADPILGFNANAFLIDLSGFSNPILPGSSFAVVLGGLNNSQLFLVYDAIPEPSAGVLLMAGFGLVLWRWRSRARALSR